MTKSDKLIIFFFNKREDSKPAINNSEIFAFSELPNKNVSLLDYIWVSHVDNGFGLNDMCCRVVAFRKWLRT